jgi:hypothetical protein
MTQTLDVDLPDALNISSVEGITTGEPNDAFPACLGVA